MASDFLVGWKEIAARVGLNERMALRARTWNPPIPVRHFGGRVAATGSVLDAWLAAKPQRPAKPAGVKASTKTPQHVTLDGPPALLR